VRRREFKKKKLTNLFSFYVPLLTLISPNLEQILIKSRRKEMCIKNTFQYEWTLTFELTRSTWQCTDVYIDIISILFHEECPDDRRGLVKRLLEKYCNNPAVLVMCDKV